MAVVTGDYWQREPTQPAQERQVTLDLSGVPGLPDVPGLHGLPGPVTLRTAAGVFGAQRVDRGTVVLLRNAPGPVRCSGVVDVGTGYGPIAVAMALRQPDAGVWAVDVNRRALALAHDNAHAVGAGNVVVAEPDDVPAMLRFDRLYSNPPIKVGRTQLHELLAGWLGRLADGGDAYLVVKQSMGADALHVWLNETGYPTARAASKQGYRLLHVAPHRAAQERDVLPAGLTADDLAVVNQATGRRWTVLGRLAGGRSDSAQLLGCGRRRAVLKIKRGEWWEGQLTRAAEAVGVLRAAGYPTPAVLGHGRLGADRFFLATEYTTGAQPVGLGRDAGPVRQVLAAVALHAQVHPDPVRDWSAMITLFLNGGITEHRFPAQLAGLAQRAFALVPHPVPALPGGEFVHGDFTVRNLLARGTELSAVIDMEGFGRGTRAIDLVALLSSLAVPYQGRTAALAAEIAEQAVAASDEATFRACLAHRVLAILLSASDDADRLGEAERRARALLALA